MPNSKITLGTVQLGMNYGITNQEGQPSRPEASAILKEAFRLGIRSLDTANAYGVAEEIIGETLQSTPNLQIEVVTKLSPLSQLTPRSSVSEVIAAVESSLRASRESLRTATLGTVLLHEPRHFTDYDGLIWKHLKKQVDEGYIQKIGLSLYSPDQLITLRDPYVQAVQIPFNLLDWRWRSPQALEMLTQRQNTTVYVRSILLQGILGSSPSLWPNLEGVDAPSIVQRMENWVTRLNRKNRTDLCFNYVRSKPWVSQIILGVASLGQLQENWNLLQSTQPLTATETQQIENDFLDIPERLLNPGLWFEDPS